MEHAHTFPDEPTPTNLTPGDMAPFTPELMARFCEVLAETGRVTAACRAVGKHRDTVAVYGRSSRSALRIRVRARLRAHVAANFGNFRGPPDARASRARAQRRCVCCVSRPSDRRRHYEHSRRFVARSSSRP